MNKIAIFLFIFLLASCKGEIFTDESEMHKYLNDVENNYVSSKEIQGLKYKLTYRPTDLLVKQELKGDSHRSSQVDSLRGKYDHFVYFNLSFSKNNKEILSSLAGSKFDFSNMVNSLSFGLKDRVHLISEKRDTISLVDYHYTRMYGMSSDTSVLLVYSRDEVIQSRKVSLAIEDLGYGTGEVKLTQIIEPILNEPRLNFSYK